MIGGGDGDHVDVLALQHPAQIAKSGHGFTPLAEGIDSLGKHGLVHIAERHHLDAFRCQAAHAGDVIAAAAIEADGGDTDLVVGTRNLGPGSGGKTDGRTGGQGGFEKRTA